MNILIAGDSDMALHLCNLFSVENHNITLICPDKDLLKVVEFSTDLMTVEGDATSPEILKNGNVGKADLLLSLYTDGRLNVLTAILGKSLGAKKCIAKVNESEYLGEKCKEHFKSLGIDYLVSPEKITAKDISNLIENTAATEIFNFTDDKLSLMLIRLDKHASVLNRSLNEIAEEQKDLNFRTIAIHRRSKTIIPKGNDVFREGDMAYVVTKQEGIKKLLKLGGKNIFNISNIMIVGGGTIGTLAAKRLEKKFSVKLFEVDKDRSNELTDILTNTLVFNGDARDINLLEDEGIGSMDALIAVTNNSETNILTCLLARKLGVKKTIALVENLDFIEISQNIGIDTIINKKLATASYIVRFTMKNEVVSTKCLTGIDAEVFEFVAKEKSPITKKPLRKLKFPEHAIVGGVIRNNQGYIATGDLQVKPGDNVVVFALPEAFQSVDKMF